MTLDDHRQTSDWRPPESRHPGMAAPGMAVPNRWCSSTLLTVLTVKNSKFQKSKVAATAILKNRKLTYLFRGLSDFDKVWHSDAVRPS